VTNNNSNSNNFTFNSGSNSGTFAAATAMDLSRLLRSPTVPGMGHALSQSYSLRG